MDRIELNVTINGTGNNPWHRFGLRQNPFPQLGKTEYAAGERQLASLDGIGSGPLTTSAEGAWPGSTRSSVEGSHRRHGWPSPATPGRCKIVSGRAPTR